MPGEYGEMTRFSENASLSYWLLTARSAVSTGLLPSPAETPTLRGRLGSVHL